MQRGRTTRPAKNTRSKAAPKSNDRDVTQYAEKDPTDLHRCFARWIVEEVGYNPNDAGSKREAFLMGVSISTAARPAFQASDYLAEWREEEGVAKRGPKGKGQATKTTAAKKGRKPAPEPEPEEDEDELAEEMEEREEELMALTVAKLRTLAQDDDHEATAADIKGLNKADLVNLILDIEFPEDEESDEEDEEDEDDYDEDEDEEEEEEEEDDEEEEEEAPKSRRGRSSSAKSSGRTTQGRQAKSSGRGESKSAKGKDDYLF